MTTTIPLVGVEGASDLDEEVVETEVEEEEEDTMPSNPQQL